MANPRILLVDNRDSYTYNLVHLVARVTGTEPDVVLVDDLDRAAACAYDAVIISPGPGHPATEPAFAGCLELLREGSVPVLGVCLGHQGLALAFGGRVERRPPAHGVVSLVHHRGDGLYAGMPLPFRAVRYHSLCVTDVPDDLVVDAWTEDGTVMGLRHRELPLFGVQFHPESILTQDGGSLVRAFLAAAGLTVERGAEIRDPGPVDVGPEDPVPDGAGAVPDVRRWPVWFEPVEAVDRLLRGERRLFWLDSSRRTSWSGRWSYLGWLDDGGESVSLDASAFDRVESLVKTTRRPHPAGIPFTGGWVGYLGYPCGDLPSDDGAPATRREGESVAASEVPEPPGAPDACLMRAVRFLAFDHDEGRVHLIAPDPAEGAVFEQEIARRLSLPGDHGIAAVSPDSEQPTSHDHRAAGDGEAAREGQVLGDGEPAARAAYDVAFGEVQAELLAGNTYETTLTRIIRRRADVDPLGLYVRLRRLNPAPYSALISHDGVWVLSSSPERFLSSTAGGDLETRPIKGTTPRGDDAQDDALHRWRLGHDAKFLAENLMVADLLRNDLSRVCLPGTVQVTELMAVESYASVHQLVTTVTGRRRPELDTFGALRALFPGGSMTGAPKQRTMEIIGRVEAEPRGVYSGALGWFGDDGACDLAIVIRTLVGVDGLWSLGVGGGIVVSSRVDEEWAETHWKAELLLAALGEAMASGSTA